MNAFSKRIWVWCVGGLLVMASGRSLGQESAVADTAPAAVTAVAVEPSSAEADNQQQETQPKGTEPKGTERQEMQAQGTNTRGLRSTTVRLPAHFASLVDSRQRAAIYEIREAMSAKIAALELQLEELRQAEMREIEAVLSDDQRHRLEALRAARSSQAISQASKPSGR